MKSNKKKEQFQIAETLFEMGLDFDVIETISGINPTELLLKQIDLINFEEKEKEE
jgi:hypothetical protein